MRRVTIGRVRPAAGRSQATTRRDALGWLAVVTAGLAITALLVAAHARLGTRGAPFIGDYRWKVEPGSLLAPAVAGLVLLAVWRGVHERLRWRWLLACAYLCAAGWALGLALVDGGNGLAGPVSRADSYAHDVAAVGGHPLAFLHGFVGHAASYTVDTRQHPPAPVLLLAGLRQLGIVRPETIGLLITLFGCLSVPLVLVAVRSLCDLGNARRLAPVLAFAPYAVWLAVSMDAVTLTLCAAFVTCGVVASEPRRTWWWAVAAGLLLGVAALFSYSVAWLAVSVICIYFVRRRPLLNVATGAAALLPLAAARVAGFTWPDGLSAAQADFSRRIGPHRSWALWIGLDLLILVIAAGPAVWPAARKVRRTPGWPFLIGAGLAVAFALASGLSRGEVERSWLPFYPWLLIPAVAPERAVGGDAPAVPAPAGTRASSSSPTPVMLVALGALSAVVIEAALKTPW